MMKSNATIWLSCVLFLIPATDLRLQNVNSVHIDIDSPHHSQIHHCIPVLGPNLFATENVDKAFYYKSLFRFNFDFYLTKYNVSPNFQELYMEYVCKHVLGSVSQHARNKIPTLKNLRGYGIVAKTVLEKLKGKISDDKLNELDRVPMITTLRGNTMRSIFYGGKSKKHHSNKSKSKKNVKKYVFGFSDI